MKNTIKLLTVAYMLISGVVTQVHANANSYLIGTPLVISNWSGGGNEDLWIKLDQPTKNPAGCANSSFYILEQSSSDLSRSIVLGAKLNNERLGLVIYGGGCTATGYPVVVNVSLR